MKSKDILTSKRGRKHVNLASWLQLEVEQNRRTLNCSENSYKCFSIEFKTKFR